MEEFRTDRYVVGQRDFVLTVDPVEGVAPVTIGVPHDGAYELQGDCSGAYWRCAASRPEGVGHCA